MKVTKLGNHEIGTFGGFHKWGYPEMDGLLRENPIEMDDLGVPPFRETSIYECLLLMLNASIIKWPSLVDTESEIRNHFQTRAK